MATLQQRWLILTAAPHRMFFATGLAWLLAWSAWWAMLLAARAAGGGGLEPARPALLVHGAASLFVAYVPFMYGFLLTVYPRWMAAPQPGRAAMLWAFGLVNAGNLLFLASLGASRAWAVAGWLLATVALVVIGATLLRILVRARTRVSHAYAALAGLAAGLAGMLLFAYGLSTGDFSAWPLVRGMGLWGLLLVVYFAVCHRMIPFFSSRVVPGYTSWRPDWILYLFVSLALARALLETAPALAWLASVPMAVIALTCALRWRPRVRTAPRLLAALHIAFAWLPLALVLAAVADLAALFGVQGLLGRAPLHALGLGFFGGMLMAMVTRVTLGHSGRPLALDPLTWRLFLAAQAAAGLRVAAEFLPPAAAWLSLAAALTWVAVLLAWAALSLPVYFRPRADGAPG
jgi:uncharacterized protein involved in response to NO